MSDDLGPGDEVICVDASPGAFTGADWLVEGASYVIAKVGPDDVPIEYTNIDGLPGVPGVSLTQEPGHWWRMERFRKRRAGWLVELERKAHEPLSEPELEPA